MKYIKSFENLSIKQEPFFLSKGDYLYVSDEFAHSISPDSKTLKKVYKKNQNWIIHELQKIKDFFSNEKTEKGYYKTSYIRLELSVRYTDDTYLMNLFLYRGSRGDYNYYIGGNSGDSDMHGKNMIRATRDCNLNFMIKFYPIVGHIKNFYSRFKAGEGFFDIIKKALDKDITLAQYGVPKELIHIYGDIEDAVKNSIKYNI